jgi:hypothetical protein
MEEEIKQEDLDNRGLDNAYRFEHNHLIKPKKEIEQEEWVDDLPIGMSINRILTFNPKTNAFLESQLYT